MAHQIDQSTGTAAVFTAGELPWHGLGRNVAAAVDSKEAITLAGLDWQVGQWPVTAIGPKGQRAQPSQDQDPRNSFVANVRLDTGRILGVVGRRYRPFQNEEAFAFCDAIVGEGDEGQRARYETAGAIREGRRVWMLLRLPEELRAGPDDLLHPYLLVFNSHDGSSPLRALLTTVRVVCANTLSLALNHTEGTRAEGGVTIRHRGDLKYRVDAARQTLGLVRQRLTQFESEIEVMRGVPMTGKRLERYFDALLPPIDRALAGPRQRSNREKKLTQLQLNFEDDTNRLPGMRGTLWAALNAATAYADHQRPVRAADTSRSEIDITEEPAATADDNTVASSAQTRRADRRLESAWFGGGAALKASAYRSALAMAGLN